MATGFDVNRSRVSDDALAEFLSKPVEEDIISVPGIGEKAAAILGTATDDDPAIETTFQLIGKFLSLKGKGMSSKEHCDAMWFYLQAKGINSYRAGIVHSIAERTNIMMPGIYESSD
mmetsp:Transcript_1059/g.1341  ORF Transcript_1059/g.1341 Transcript_1059/m.1341 type:complete len:117 (+) Transcript_1059:196-546(+)|eukprot:CAMPEP_0204828948 /NCGR_PEP_ID=MMETSP1346-20131115/6918_1 /ASSEMBLY_ACC=CAM_ASM_000771 /TAXON_ID=215587 /ORGANISM="Aplanochytrium stocchinoi, Strain GSBS06" /LENGTH=116 /DNA_ID=CAMNT_0051958369 /DNA_START=100 /DNA_END=450 /DNA_ORIENTATION=+